MPCMHYRLKWLFWCNIYSVDKMLWESRSRIFPCLFRAGCVANSRQLRALGQQLVMVYDIPAARVIIEVLENLVLCSVPYAYAVL